MAPAPTIRMASSIEHALSHGRTPYLHASSILPLGNGKELNSPMLRRLSPLRRARSGGERVRLPGRYRRPAAQAETTKVFAADGSLITTLHAEQDREEVPLTEMAPTLNAAVLAIEDARFFSHKGVDLRAVARATAQQRRGGRGGRRAGRRSPSST